MTFRRSPSLLGFAGVAFGLFAAAACSDAKAVDSPSTPGTDAGPTADSSTDACTPSAPPAGLTQLVPGDKQGNHVVMTLDDTGSPVVAYQKDSGDGSASAITIEMKRWISSCGKWSDPIHVDTFGYQTGNGRQIVLALDKSSGAIGIAYQAVIGKFGTDEHYELRYAELPKGATAITPPQRVEDPKDNDHAPASPGLGMANGKVFVAYQEPYRLCGTSGCAAIVYRSRGTDGKWSAETELPGNGDAGSGDALENHTSIAVDESGNPAVAWVSSKSAPGTGGVKMNAQFIRPGDAAPSTIFQNTDSTGTDEPWVEVAFDGNKPRAVVTMNQNANYSTDGHTVWFVASDDGKTWKAPVALPHDNGSGLDRFASIAIGAGGKVVIAVDSNTSDGTQEFGAPKLLSSTDLTTFTVGGIARSTYEGTAHWVSAKIGPDGKTQFVMQGPASSDEKHVGVLYYREP